MTEDIREIFTQFKGKIYALALGITHDTAAAEDIVQNTFLKALTHMKSFNRRSRLSTWLYRIAYNEAIGYLRKKRWSQDVSLDEIAAAKSIGRRFVTIANRPDRQAMNNELAKRIETAIHDMPIRYRIPFILGIAEEMPIKEISRILNLKANSVKTRMRRARALMRGQISAYLKDREYSPAKPGKKCVPFLKFIYDYAYGSLGKEKALSFDAHIDDCRPCKNFLRQYRNAIRVTKALECRDLSPELEAKISDFIRRES